MRGFHVTCENLALLCRRGDVILVQHGFASGQRAIRVVDIDI